MLAVVACSGTEYMVCVCVGCLPCGERLQAMGSAIMEI